MVEQIEHPSLNRRTCVWLLLLALAVYAGGIKKNLPYLPEVDEALSWVSRAVTMAASGDLNPRWFGPPGSTVLYPLAASYRLGFGPDVLTDFIQNQTPFYLIARSLSILYAALSIPVVYALGVRVFNHPVAVLGSLLFLFSRVVLEHVQVVRSDSAAVLFGTLALLAMVRLYDQPTLRRHIQVGLWIGLAISSRYFMAALCGALLVIQGAVWLRSLNRRTVLLHSAVGLLVALLTFGLTTPYLMLDFRAALASIMVEARQTHLGADGLSPAGNLWWYLATALPRSLTWPQYLCSALGVVAVLAGRRFLPLWLLGYAVMFVLGISALALHWQRWLIPILPLISLLAGAGLWHVLRWLAEQRLPIRGPRFAFGLLAVVVLAMPVSEAVLYDIRQARASTRLVAREWLLAHVPPESQIIQEWYGAALQQTTFAVTETNNLASAGLNLDEPAPYTYAVASSSMYDRFRAEPGRYAAEVAFYERLFTRPLVFEARPDLFRGGPIIRVYKLDEN